PLARAQSQHDRPESRGNLEPEVRIVGELPALFSRAQIGRHYLDRRYARRMDQGPAALYSGEHDDISRNEGRAPPPRPARIPPKGHATRPRAQDWSAPLGPDSLRVVI